MGGETFFRLTVWNKGIRLTSNDNEVIAPKIAIVKGTIFLYSTIYLHLSSWNIHSLIEHVITDRSRDARSLEESL
jgi:hypothetical protein